MNIFILSDDPVEAAKLQCNKHIVKMPTESAQMLSTAHRILDGTKLRAPSKTGKTMTWHWKHPNSDIEDVLYQAVHMSHPCTLWTMETDSNYLWHYQHFVALATEYEYRYEKVHDSYRKLHEILKNPPKNIKSGDLTPFPLAMKQNPECIVEGDPIASYRNFYMTKQDRFEMNWKKREVPDWFEYVTG